MRVRDLTKFIIARESLRVRKENGQEPWTKDPILAKYRFCNVHREDDSVTRWLRDNYYSRFGADPDIWFAAVVARLLNNPESLDEVAIQRSYVLPWKPAAFARTLHARAKAGEKNFNAAYIVSTNGVAMDKVDYIVSRVLGPLWAARKNNPSAKPSFLDEGRELQSWHEWLMNFDGLGSFIAAQIVADLKYMPPLINASDWHTFAASGPGSRRGLNRVMGYNPDLPWREPHWRRKLAELQEAIKPLELHAQDLQNCLCEFDKYERARLGEGTPKQLYREKAQ